MPSSKLLDLPRELRDEIWYLALVGNGTPFPVTHGALSNAQRGALNLRMACKQIYKETTKIFYQDNIFRIDCSDVLVQGQAMRSSTTESSAFRHGMWLILILKIHI